MTTKNRLKEICTLLGAHYRMDTVDFEDVIYRDFGNGYEIVISSGNNHKEDLNLWLDVRCKEYSAPVKTIRNITSTMELKQYLDMIISEHVHSQAGL
ncbi:hypothetical protein SOV_17080 [Sporomusa ovata DSM 2662]|uniref:hypothetical protein n=1 Tax=Sporomusa ovata TaxID=2378 RepID=UPI0003887FD8|nr:hypothetical protein [Sporomusa ovata]EQB29308.1 hypothetical protein SOV_1c10410 [Sporomusa ovata DSM 2662]